MDWENLTLPRKNLTQCFWVSYSNVLSDAYTEIIILQISDVNCVLEGHVSPQRERLEDQHYWKQSVYKIYSVGGGKKKKKKY